MSERKHTPGPWKIERYDHKNDSGRFEIWIAPEGAGEWGNFDGEISSLNTFHANEMDLANAALIASAPALLAALERLLPIADGSAPCVGGRYESALAQARAAIARAKGE